MANIKLEEFEAKANIIIEVLREEITRLRSGRANPDLVSGVMVESYGQKMPLNQLANISVADATLLVVQPWDKSIIDAVVKALSTSDIGITPLRDGDVIRLPLPALTQERREEYVKILKQKLEEARIKVRQVRKDVLTGLESDKKEGNMSEDDFDRKEKELQQKVDQTNAKIDEIGSKKEQDLMQV